MRINVSMPDDFLKEVDKYCVDNKLQRSELIRHLLRVEIYHEKSLVGADKLPPLPIKIENLPKPKALLSKES